MAESIKFAGPDRNGNYRVISTRNTYLVETGQLYTRKAYRAIVDMAKRRGQRDKMDVDCVQYKPSSLEDFGFPPDEVVLDRLPT